MTVLKTEQQNKIQTYWKAYEIVYFIILSIVLLAEYHQITMFKALNTILWFTLPIEMIGDLALPFLIIFNFMFMLFSLAGRCKGTPFYWNKEEILIAVICCGIFIAVRLLAGYGDVFIFAALMIGAHGIDFKKIIKFYFVVSLVFCVFTIICGLTGVVENLVYYRANGARRISFGFIYPTDFCSHIFYLTAIWVWLRKEKISFYEIFGILALSIFTLIACNARTTTLTLAIMFVWLFIAKILSLKNDNKTYKMSRLFQFLCIALAPLATVFMTVVSIFYSPENSLLVKLDGLIEHRISLQHKGFVDYGFSLFGQQVSMVGNGGSTQLPKNYFFLDCTYINVLIRYGILALFVVLFVLLYLMLLQKKKQSYIRLGILGLIALQCVIEQHLLEFGHCPIFLALLAFDSEIGKGFSFENLKVFNIQKKSCEQ